MEICFDTSRISTSEAHALIQLLGAICPLSESAPSQDPAANEETAEPLTLNPQPVAALLGVAPAAILADTGSAVANKDSAVKEPARRRGRPKAEAAAEPVAAASAQASQAQPEPQAQVAPVATAKPLTVDDLRALLNGFISRHSMEEVIEVLKSFGCNRVSEAAALEPVKLAELAEKLNG